MKIIKVKVRLQGNIIGSLVLILLFYSCKNETIKNDFSMIGGVQMNTKNSRLLEQNNWKLRRLLIFDTTNDSAKLIKEKEFNRSVRFKDSLIFLDNKEIGYITKFNNYFIIKEIDTLTNNYKAVVLSKKYLELNNFVTYKNSTKRYQIKLLFFSQ